MMQFYYDLHIHTCLSPCADDDMTPNNIVNMAIIKGLDIIAITDHNSIGNCKSVMEAAALSEKLLIIPAMELCTADEVHMLCLFPDLIKASFFQNELKRYMPMVENKEHIFGRQVYMDSEDRELGTESFFLAGATNLETQSAVSLVRALEGAVIPAHIDRESFSMLYNLGSIPPEYGFKFLECSKGCDPEKFILSHQALNDYKYIKSSDAHYLGDIMERENYFELEEKSARCLIEKINTGYCKLSGS